VELELGRRRTVVNGPRTIDIDILLFGEAAVKTPELEVPHPRFRERRFVLAPLVELNPELRDPVTRRTVSDLLQDVKGQAVKRLQAGKNG
jgi:2-amino-4-hydroxy-6-hydroxymethyldihydropteridine diphosphokinase